MMTTHYHLALDQSYSSTPLVCLQVVDMNTFTVRVRAIIILALYYVPYF